LVAGANGLVGGYLVQALLEAPDYSRVFALTRRPYGREHPKLANRIVIYSRIAEQLKGTVAHDAFCCIGSTIAAAGSQEAFRAADVDAVMLFARAARAAGATRLVVVSSVRADPDSKNFYLRTKGEMEDAVATTGFPSLDILQPGLLLGPRKESRPMEALGRLLAPLLNPSHRFPRGLEGDPGRDRGARDAGCGAPWDAWHLPLHLRGHPAARRAAAPPTRAGSTP
jgi:uncharacterized protein YbjT (DUF2867 family)